MLYHQVDTSLKAPTQHKHTKGKPTVYLFPLLPSLVYFVLFLCTRDRSTSLPTSEQAMAQANPPLLFLGRESTPWFVLVDRMLGIWTTLACSFGTLLWGTLGHRSKVPSLPTIRGYRERCMPWRTAVSVITFEDGKEVAMCDCHRVIMKRSPIVVTPATSPLLASNKLNKPSCSIVAKQAMAAGPRTPSSKKPSTRTRTYKTVTASTEMRGGPAGAATM